MNQSGGGRHSFIQQRSRFADYSSSSESSESDSSGERQRQLQYQQIQNERLRRRLQHMNIQLPNKKKHTGLSPAQIDLLPTFKHIIKEEAASQEMARQMDGGRGVASEDDN